MKLTLSIDEVHKIVRDHLVKEGKIPTEAAGKVIHLNQSLNGPQFWEQDFLCYSWKIKE